MSLTETNGAPAPSEAIPAPVSNQAISVHEAADAISALLRSEDTSEKPRAPNGQFAPRQESTAQAEDAAPEEAPPSGEDTGAEPAELPPIEPPLSWTKEEKEEFLTYPREAQEKIARREQERDAATRRNQNEAAERTKALEAKEQAAEQARQQYESAAQNALQILQDKQLAEFGDIKTDADVMKLATEDPFRFAQWQARQMQIQARAQEVQQLNEQRQTKDREQFEKWSKEQDDEFTKKYPVFADAEKAGPVRSAVLTDLKARMSESEFNALVQIPGFRHAAIQGMAYESYLWRQAQQKAKQAVAAPKPPVQRPGTPAPKSQQFEDEIAAASARQKGKRGIEAVRAGADAIAATLQSIARQKG